MSTPPERPKREPAPLPEQARPRPQRASGADRGDQPPRLLGSEHRTPVIIAVVAVVVLVLAGLSVPLARFLGDQATGPVPTATPSPRDTGAATPSPSPDGSVGPTAPPPSDSASASSPPAEPSPGSAAPPYERTDYDGTGAVDNVLYNLYEPSGGGACGDLEVHDARTPLAGQALTTELEQLITCNHRALAGPMKTVDVEVSRPELEVYDGETDSPCGMVRATDHPAYYCPANETIYFPDELDSSGAALTLARLGYVDLVAHEFGHHLQHRSGIYDDYTEWYYAADEQEQLGLTRRSELQAQCFSTLFVGYVADALSVTAADLEELDAMHRMMGDDHGAGRTPTHGSAAAQLHWMERGLGDGWSDYGQCNTWLAGEDEVR